MAARNPGKTPTAQILPFPSPRSPEAGRRLVALSPEFQGYCLLYAHHALSTDKLYAIRILCWARQADGRDVAMVPWLNGVARCTELNDAQSGLAQGYFDPLNERPFNAIPAHQRITLDSLAEQPPQPGSGVIQEIPDLIGSHAALMADNSELRLEPVVSWQLLADGSLQAMLADSAKITQQPVLPGDPCLYAASEARGLRYYFQYHIANQIKSGGALSARALSTLIKH